MIEEWKLIDSAQNYSISNHGRVRSEVRVVPSRGGTRVIPSNPIKTQCNEHTEMYHKVRLRVNGRYKSFWVHRLVAIAYIPNHDNKPCVNHIDNNPQNNMVDNLEWVTFKENSQHAVKQGRLTGKTPVDLKILERAKVLVEQGVPYNDVAEQVGCNRTTLYKYFPVKWDTKL